MRASFGLQQVIWGGGFRRLTTSSFFNHGIRTGPNSVLFCGLRKELN